MTNISYQVLRHEELESKTGLSRSTLYAMRNKKSPYYDASAPKAVRLSKRSIGFYEHEVDQWLLARSASRS
ncbi:AlpA family phage regulatory protein [Xanthomonas campestris pv. badrii]|uniref:AlpA family phage regulatory protein n=1 Tax=Xanthomonas campestris pv. badrii TaxID=149696 RepID=A0A7Z2VCW3_XANCA|nr:AlpA family phage regulatory protein [Xanthomonas campestris]QJD69052.1 AlpA family phage regulatory protein [Xanthomonas campestris pv. badrii]